MSYEISIKPSYFDWHAQETATMKQRENLRIAIGQLSRAVHSVRSATQSIPDNGRGDIFDSFYWASLSIMCDLEEHYSVPVYGDTIISVIKRIRNWRHSSWVW